MMKNIILILLFILFISCKYKEQKIVTNEVSSIEKKDTFFIENNQVLFISPSSKDFDEMKKRMGEENFYTIADDANFYGANAYEFLDSLNVSYANTDSDAIVAYKKNNKTEILIPIKSKWYSLLNKNEQLIKIDLVTFEDNYKKYNDATPININKGNISIILKENTSTPKK